MKKLFLALLLPLFNLMSCSGTRPANLGVEGGRFAPCPSSPNCVSTQAADAKHRMAPIPYEGSRREALERLIKVVGAMEGAEIVATRDDYLYAEFTSKLWGFVDDVEFYIEEKPKLIQFRSASRLGYSDLGVNRKRMARITKEFRSGG